MLEEADESLFWLELIVESGMQSNHMVTSIHHEADSLVRIMTSSIKTARAKLQTPDPAPIKSEI